MLLPGRMVRAATPRDSFGLCLTTPTPEVAFPVGTRKAFSLAGVTPSSCTRGISGERRSGLVSWIPEER